MMLRKMTDKNLLDYLNLVIHRLFYALIGLYMVVDGHNIVWWLIGAIWAWFNAILLVRTLKETYFYSKALKRKTYDY